MGRVDRDGRDRRRTNRRNARRTDRRRRHLWCGHLWRARGPNRDGRHRDGWHGHRGHTNGWHGDRRNARRRDAHRESGARRPRRHVRERARAGHSGRRDERHPRRERRAHAAADASRPHPCCAHLHPTTDGVDIVHRLEYRPSLALSQSPQDELTPRSALDRALDRPGRRRRGHRARRPGAARLPIPRRRCAPQPPLRRARSTSDSTRQRSLS